MPRGRFSPLDVIRKFLPPETFDLLNAPTKASLEMRGQEQLPLGEDFTDPTDPVKQYREHMAQMDAREHSVLAGFERIRPDVVAPADTWKQPELLNATNLWQTPKTDVPIGQLEETYKAQLDQAKRYSRPGQRIPAHLVDQYGPSESETLHGMGDLPQSALDTIVDWEATPIPEVRTPEIRWVERFPKAENRPELEEAWRRGEISAEDAKAVVAFWQTGIEKPGLVSQRVYPESVNLTPAKSSPWVNKDDLRATVAEKHYDGQNLSDEDYEAKYGHRKPVYQVDPATLPTRTLTQEVWDPNSESPYPEQRQVVVPGQKWWDPISLAEQAREAQAAVEKPKYPVKPKGKWNRAKMGQDIRLVPSHGQRSDAVYPPGKWQQYGIEATPGDDTDPIAPLNTRRLYSAAHPKEGTGLRFVPSLEGMAEQVLKFGGPAGKDPINLYALQRRMEEVTSEGLSQRLAPSKVPYTPSAKLAADSLVEMGIVTPDQIQVYWDRVMAEKGPFNGGSMEAAERHFDDVTMGMVDAYNGLRAVGERDAEGGYQTERIPLLNKLTPEHRAMFDAEVGAFRPDQETPEEYRKVVQDFLAKYEPVLTHDERVRLAQSYIAESRSLVPGIGGEGFGERTLDEDESFNAAQIIEKGMKGLGSSFQGNPNKTEEREGTGRIERTVDSKQRFKIGQVPLEAINKLRAGMRVDQTHNIREGLTDLMVVDRGTFEVGPQRLGTDDPFDIEVAEVIPFSEAMKAGYLSQVSQRTGIPIRNLKILAELGDWAPPELQARLQMDLVRIKPLAGYAAQPDLPPMARRRNPEDLRFHADAEGAKQRARVFNDPALLKRILESPSARILGAMKGAGHDYVAIYTGKNAEGKPQVFGVKLLGQGKFEAVPLTKHEGRLIWKMEWDKKQGKKVPKYFAPNIVARDPLGDKWQGGTKPDGFDKVTGVVVPPLDPPRPESPKGPALGMEGVPFEPELHVRSYVPHLGVPGRLQSEPAGGFVTGTPRDDVTYARTHSWEKPLPKYYPELDPETNAEVVELPQVPGLKLSPTPIRTQEDLAKFPFHLARAPLTEVGVSPDMQLLPNGVRPDLTIVITQRRPSPKNPEGFAEYKSTENRTMVNPTADQIRDVLLHSDVKHVVFKVMEGEKEGEVDSKSRAANTWHRAKALMAEVRNPPTLREATPLANKPNLGMTSGEVQEFPGQPLPEGVVSPNKKYDVTPPEQASSEKVFETVQERMFEEGLHGLPRSVSIDPKVLDTLRMYEKGGPPASEPKPKPGRWPKSEVVTREQAERKALKKLPEAELSTDEDIRKVEQEARRAELAAKSDPDRTAPEGFGGTTDLIKAHRQRRALRALLKGGKLSAGAMAILFGKNFLSDDDQAEASTLGKTSWRANAEATMAAREASTPEGYQLSIPATLRKQFLDMFTPIYKGIVHEGGTEADALALREQIATASGGSGAEAAIDYEPIRLTVDRFAQQGLGTEFDMFMTYKQGLRQWDIVAAKRDQLLMEARIARGRGQKGLAAQKTAIANEINKRMAENQVWQNGDTKEDLVAKLKDLRSEIGMEKFAEMQDGSKEIYAPIQAKLDEMYEAGLIPEESYKLYKERGADHIPAFKTPWEINKETGKLTYTGGEKFEAHSTSIKGTTEQLLEEVMGSASVVKSPFENASQFITEATAEIARSKIATAVIDKFEPLGVVKRVKAKPGQQADDVNSFYTVLEKGQPVTYEMPKYLVDTLLMVDKDLTRKLMTHMPGARELSMLRALPEAGMTTLNLGFGLSQATVIDPISALIQTEWANDKVLRNVAPFARRWFTHLIDGINRGEAGESSAMRKRAAKAGALHAGAMGQATDPRDLLGNQAWKRAGKSFGEGKYGQALHQGIQGALYHPTKRFMQPLEEATKLATFDLLTSQGMDDTKAAYQTRKYGGSPDWGQGGDKDTILRMGVTFGRPALLGIEAGLMAARRKPIKLMKVMMGTLATEVARQTWNQMTAAELGIPQDELENRYSEYDKDNTFLVMVPPTVAKKIFGQEQETLSNGIERPYAIKHTIPPVLRLWMSPFNALAKAIHSGNPVDVPLGIADEMVPGTVPLKADNLLGTGFRRVAASVPSPLRAPLEYAVDQQAFTGAPIIGSRLAGRNPRDQYSETTSPTYRWLGQQTGLSPKAMEHFGDAFLPGPFQLPIQVADEALRDKTVPGVQKGALEGLADIPLLGPTLFKRFTPQRYEEELGDLQDKFYGLNDRTRASATALSKFNKGIGLKPDEMTFVLGNVNPEVNAVVRQLSDLSTMQQQVIWDQHLNPQDKQDYIKRIITAKRDLLRGFLANPAAAALANGELPPTLRVPGY